MRTERCLDVAESVYNHGQWCQWSGGGESLSRAEDSGRGGTVVSQQRQLTQSLAVERGRDTGLEVGRIKEPALPRGVTASPYGHFPVPQFPHL